MNIHAPSFGAGKPEINEVDLIDYLGGAQVVLNWSDQLEGVSSELGDAVKGLQITVEPATGHKCPRCWRYYDALVTEVCQRCEDALQEQKKVA